MSDDYYAYINDGYDLVNIYQTGKTIGYDNEAMFKDIDIERFESLRKCAPKNFFCGIKNMIVITESGNLSLCCNVMSKNKEYELGDILSFKTKKEIFEAKLKAQNSQFCRLCEKVGIPYIFACQNVKI